MTAPTSPAWTLGGHNVDTVWDAGHGLSLPTLVEIDDTEDVAAHEHPEPGATTLRLAPSLHGLTEEIVQDLLELLVGIQEIRPPEVHIVARAVSVPLLAPNTITDDRVEWTITDHLSLVHADRNDIYFALTEPTARAANGPHVDLTPAQTWLLVRALTTIRCWQFELETAFYAAATELRLSLVSAGSPAAADPAAARAVPVS